LREFGNDVANDPYYPKSCDIETLYDKGSIERLFKCVMLLSLIDGLNTQLLNMHFVLKYALTCVSFYSH
jgi:hypothetical protein